MAESRSSFSWFDIGTSHLSRYPDVNIASTERQLGVGFCTEVFGHKPACKQQFTLCEDSRRFHEQDGHSMTQKQHRLRFIRADLEIVLSELKSYNQP